LRGRAVRHAAACLRIRVCRTDCASCGSRDRADYSDCPARFHHSSFIAFPDLPFLPSRATYGEVTKRDTCSRLLFHCPIKLYAAGTRKKHTDPKHIIIQIKPLLVFSDYSPSGHNSFNFRH
jgi:hypothetical protein